MERRRLQQELQHAVQKHEPVYRDVKDLREDKAVLQDTTKKHKDGTRVDKNNSVWYRGDITRGLDAGGLHRSTP